MVTEAELLYDTKKHANRLERHEFCIVIPIAEIRCQLKTTHKKQQKEKPTNCEKCKRNDYLNFLVPL